MQQRHATGSNREFIDHLQRSFFSVAWAGGSSLPACLCAGDLGLLQLLVSMQFFCDACFHVLTHMQVLASLWQPFSPVAAQQLQLGRGLHQIRMRPGRSLHMCQRRGSRQ